MCRALARLVARGEVVRRRTRIGTECVYRLPGAENDRSPNWPERPGAGLIVWEWFVHELRLCYGDRVRDVVARRPTVAELTMGRFLLEKRSPHDEVVLPHVRCVVWDWDAARNSTERTLVTWLARRSEFPTLRDVVTLDGRIDLRVGITSRASRTSAYVQRYVAPPPPLRSDAEDPIGAVARREGKTKAQIVREIQSGQRADPRATA